MGEAQRQTLEGAVPEWTLGDRLRKAREHAGLTQTKMAEQIGIARNSVGRYESGDTRPPRPVLIAWAFRTGVELHWIETGKAYERAASGAPGVAGLPVLGVMDNRYRLPRVDSNHQPAGYSMDQEPGGYVPQPERLALRKRLPISRPDLRRATR